jgi:hypothetical protein
LSPFGKEWPGLVQESNFSVLAGRLRGSSMMLAVCFGLVSLLPTEAGVRHGVVAAAE